MILRIMCFKKVVENTVLSSKIVFMFIQQNDTVAFFSSSEVGLGMVVVGSHGWH